MNTPFAPDSPSAAPQELTDLCLACGLCCNGVLHAYTIVAASEVETLQSLGTPVYSLGAGEFAFAQPCPHWQENRCTIYADRPKSCRTYECLLFKKLAAGLISASESAARLQKAHKLIAQSQEPSAAYEKTAHLRSYLRRYFEPEPASIRD